MRKDAKKGKEKKEEKFQEVDIEMIREGMRAAKDVYNEYGTIIVRAKREIKGKHIQQFRLSNVKKIPILPYEDSAPQQRIHINQYPQHLEKLRKATVLVVDDSKAAVFVIKSALEDAGLKIAGEAFNADEALQVAPRLKPSCITLDITMPGREGTAIIPRLLELCPTTKIVMVSSSGYQDRIVESLELGAVKFISKPYNPETLKKVVIDAIVAP